MPTEIPLTSDPSAVFEITLATRVLRLQTKYNLRGGRDERGYWTLDIYENEQPLVAGIALVLGADLLRAYNLNIGSLIMLDRTDAGLDASENSLGDTTILLHYEPEELN